MSEKVGSKLTRSPGNRVVRLSRHGAWALLGSVPAAVGPANRRPGHKSPLRNPPARNSCDFFDLTAASRVVTRKSANSTVGALTDLQSCAILLIGESKSWKPS